MISTYCDSTLQTFFSLFPPLLLLMSLSSIKCAYEEGRKKSAMRIYNRDMSTSNQRMTVRDKRQSIVVEKTITHTQHFGCHIIFI